MTQKAQGSRRGGGFRLNLNMTKVMIYIVVLVAGLPALSMYLFPNTHTQLITEREAQKAKNRQARHDAFVLPIVDAAGKAGSVLVTVGVLILLVGSTGLVAALVYKKRQKARVDAINQDVLELANGVIVDRRTLITYTPEEGRVEVGLLDDRNLQGLALTGETRVRSINALGSADPSLLKYAAPNKLLAGAYDSTPNQPDYYVEETEQLQLSDTSLSRISALEAVYNSDEEQWIVGQNTRSLECFAHEPKKFPHIALHGGTNQGKTAGLAFAFITHARRSGYYVVVLDGKAGLDFAETPALQSLYEWHDLNSNLLLSYVQQLTNIMLERQQLLRSHGVSTLNKLHKKHPEAVEKYPNILVVWEELGVAVDTLKGVKKGDKEVKPFDAFEALFSNLLRLCRTFGLYMLLIDQDRDKWSSSMKSNAGVTYTFSLGGYQTQSVAPGAPSDIPQHHFWNDNDGKMYKAWDWTEELSIPEEIGPQRNRNILKGGEGFNLFTPTPGDAVLPCSIGENLFQYQVGTDIQDQEQDRNTAEQTRNTGDDDGNKNVTWDEIRDLNRPDREAYLKSVSLGMKLPIDSNTKRRTIYQVYLSLGQDLSDTCFYVFGSKGRNYQPAKQVIEEIEASDHETTY